MARQKGKASSAVSRHQTHTHPFRVFFNEKRKSLPTERKKHGPTDTTPARQRLMSSVPAASEKKGIRLNKFLANAGIAARRKADELIKAGWVTVNDQVITQMGYRVFPGDVIKYKGQPVEPGRKVYILFNKPKDCITTTNDERGRKTVMDYVKRFTKEPVYPVGRLDRNTTGLLLLTNDGALAQKLSHPRYRVKKVYALELDKPLKQEDMEKIKKGIVLEEGIVMVDDIQYTDQRNKRCIGLELHIGWNRVVRRLFESLGYEVKKLDRVMYAGLTKKDLPRGRCRYLTPEEIIRLKHFI